MSKREKRQKRKEARKHLQPDRRSDYEKTLEAQVALAYQISRRMELKVKSAMALLELIGKTP